MVRDRIVDICHCEGQTVAKGDVLVRLDDREAQATLKELRTREEFLKREIDARHRADGARRDHGAGVRARLARPRANPGADRGAGSQDQGLHHQVAPMDGIVLRRDGEIGEIAEVGQVLFRVGVPKPLEVVAEVNEEDIPRVAVGQNGAVAHRRFPGQRLEATVREITPMGDPVTKTYRIRLALPDDTPLRPGMSVEANVISREKPDALLVPSDAIQDNAVFVIEGGRAQRRKVERRHSRHAADRNPVRAEGQASASPRPARASSRTARAFARSRRTAKP